MYNIRKSFSEKNEIEEILNDESKKKYCYIIEVTEHKQQGGTDYEYKVLGIYTQAVYELILGQNYFNLRNTSPLSIEDLVYNKCYDSGSFLYTMIDEVEVNSLYLKKLDALENRALVLNEVKKLKNFSNIKVGLEIDGFEIELSLEEYIQSGLFEIIEEEKCQFLEYDLEKDVVNNIKFSLAEFKNKANKKFKQFKKLQKKVILPIAYDVVSKKNKLTAKELYISKNSVIVSNEDNQTEYSNIRNFVEEIVIPNTVKVIGQNAFAGFPNLKRVVIPDTVEVIEAGAFCGCSMLKEVKLPEKLVEIPKRTFEGCKRLKKINLPPNIVRIGESAFKGCENLEELTVPESLVGIEESAFEDCKNLKYFHLNDNVEYIGDKAFKNCRNLVDITFPKILKQIGDYAFEGCFSGVLDYNYMNQSMDEVKIIWESLGIDKDLIDTYNQKLVMELQFPASISNIGEGAFMNCLNLYSIYFEPESNVKNVKERTFAGCKILRSAVLPGEVGEIDELDESIFEGCENVKICKHQSSKNISKKGVLLLKDIRNLLRNRNKDSKDL